MAANISAQTFLPVAIHWMFLDVFLFAIFNSYKYAYVIGDIDFILSCSSEYKILLFVFLIILILM